MPIRPALTPALCLALCLAVFCAAPAFAKKTLRYVFPVAETNFDPAQVTDLYSNTVIRGIFEGPLEYEYLAKPARIRPATAAAMPEVSADYRTFTVRIKPGILFADDPAFKGAKRELVAADYVYSLKRHYDPRWRAASCTCSRTPGSWACRSCARS